MRLDSRQLRYFLAVAEELHFGRAAARLNMSQPPLSQQIRQLEEQLGAQLLERTPRSVRLLPAGQVLLAQARAILGELERTVELVQSTARGEGGLLRLGYTAASAFTLLPSLIRAYKQRYPHVEVVLMELLSSEQADALVQQRLDVGLMRPTPARAQLRTQTLVQEPLVLALPAGHPLAQQPEVQLQQLHGQDLIGFTSTEARYLHDLVDALLGAAGVQPRVVQRATQPHTMLSLVSAALGLAIVPQAAALAPVEGVAYRPLRAPGAATLATVQLAWRAGDERALLHNFLQLARTAVAPQPGAISPA
ncbi:LysR family transcriptional regulator [Alicycliphilus denitrificans]|uniref:LysR family transcriptional regulator n=1 Tax=Alicycliphilus denitrificans TaxID=179636 RepID=UPI003A810FCB